MNEQEILNNSNRLEKFLKNKFNLTLTDVEKENTVCLKDCNYIYLIKCSNINGIKFIYCTKYYTGECVVEDGLISINYKIVENLKDSKRIDKKEAKQMIKNFNKKYKLFNPLIK